MTLRQLLLVALVEAPSLDFATFSAEYFRRKPIAIRGLASKWSACSEFAGGAVRPVLQSQQNFMLSKKYTLLRNL